MVVIHNKLDFLEDFKKLLNFQVPFLNEEIVEPLAAGNRDLFTHIPALLLSLLIRINICGMCI